MDFDEVDQLLKNKPPRAEHARAKHGRKGKPVAKPKSMIYDDISDNDSDASKFSRGAAHRDSNSSSEREEQKRERVKQQLQKRQQEQLAQRRREQKSQWEQERDVQDLTGTSTPVRQRSSFDGISLWSNEKTNQIIRQMDEQGLLHHDDDVEDSVRGPPKGRRGQKHLQNSLSNLQSGSRNGRMLSRDRNSHRQSKQQNGDFLDEAIGQQRDHASAAEFRSPNNFTGKMGSNMDTILGTNNQRFGHTRPEKRFGGASTESIRSRKKKDQIQMNSTTQKQKNFFDGVDKQKKEKQNDYVAIPKKKQPQQPAIDLREDDDDTGMPLGNDTSMDAIKDFIQADDERNSPTGKRKERGSRVEELEVAESNRSKMRSGRRGGADSPLDVDTEDVSERKDCGSEGAYDDDDDVDNVMSALSSCYNPPSRDDYVDMENARRKSSNGRSNVNYAEYREQASNYERDASSNFALVRVNDREPKGSRKKAVKSGGRTARALEESIRSKDPLEDYDSDDGKKKKVDSDKTLAMLKKSGMRQASPLPSTTVNDGWLDRRSPSEIKKNKKRRSKTKSLSQDSSLDTEYHNSPPKRTTRRSKSKAKVEGSTNDSAITIDDSSSEESSVENDDVEAAAINEEADEVELLSQGTLTRSMRATGDLLGIDIARIAIGKKVFRSKCALKLQLGTKDPYLLIVFTNEQSKKVEIKVYLKVDDLKEFRYYVVDEKDESDAYDDSLSIIAMCVKPSRQNKLLEYKEWYDGDLDVDDSDTKYITMELRDTDQFNEILATKIMSHDELALYCMQGDIKFHDLDNYTKALVKDDNAEKAKRRSGPRTRSRGKNKVLSDSENKLLIVYPFKAEEEHLQRVSSELKELGGDRLGVDEVMVDVAMADASEEDTEVEEGEENNRVESGSSSRTHYLSIRQDDKERLEPGQFLNDTLVDFWMSWISRNHSSSTGNQVHFFTSHFLTTIQEEGPEGVKSWTQNKKRTIPVFEKKFLFVPVNGDLHWSLCVIVNPGKILQTYYKDANDMTDEEKEKTEWPCILFLDSLKMHRKMKVARQLRQWLNFEWNRSMNDEAGFEKNPFTENKMALVAPRVPYQDNGCDCGVFVCRYAYNLYLMRNQIFSFADIEDHFKTLITEGPAFDFDMRDIARIREEIKVLVNALSPLYHAYKKEEKAQRAAAKNKEKVSSKTPDQEVARISDEKENSPVQNADLADEETAL